MQPTEVSVGIPTVILRHVPHPPMSTAFALYAACAAVLGHP